MRNLISKLYLVVAPALIVACNDVADENSPVGQTQEVTFTAGITSRSVLNDDYTINWSPSENIAVFAIGGEALKFTSLSEEVTSVATFKGIYVDDDSDVHYSLYPFDENSRANYAEKSITFDIPSTQNYTESLLGSFADGANPAVAIANGELQDNNLKFKNLCGSLQLQISGEGCVMSRMEISAVTAGGDAQVVAGEATVDMSNPSSPVIELDEAGDSVLTLDFGVGGYPITSSVSKITAVLPPTEMGTTLNVDITLNDGTKVSTIVVSDETHNIIQRSGIYVAPKSYNILSDGAVESVNLVNIDNISADNYPEDALWVISSDAQPTAAQIANVAAAANAYGQPLSIIFNDVTTLGSDGVASSAVKGENLISIEFPSLTNIEENAFVAWSNVAKLSFTAKSKLVVASGAFDGFDTEACDLAVDTSLNDPVVVPDWMGYVWQSINGARVYSISELDEAGYLADAALPVGDMWVFKANNENQETVKRMWLAVVNNNAPVGVKIIGELSSGAIMLFKFDGDNANTLSNFVTSLDLSQVKGLNRLEDSACRELKKLQYVNLPASMKYIGDRTFNDCPSLARVEYNGNSAPVLEENEGAEVRKVADFAFFGCAFESIDLSWANVVGNGILSGCSNLTSVNLSSVTTFGREVVANANKLISIDMRAEGDFTFTGNENTAGENLFYGVHHLSNQIDLTLNADKFNQEATPYATELEWLLDGRTADLNPLTWKSITFIKTRDSFDSDNESLVPVL